MLTQFFPSDHNQPVVLSFLLSVVVPASVDRSCGLPVPLLGPSSRTETRTVGSRASLQADRYIQELVLQYRRGTYVARENTNTNPQFGGEAHNFKRALRVSAGSLSGHLHCDMRERLDTRIEDMSPYHFPLPLLPNWEPRVELTISE